MALPHAANRPRHLMLLPAATRLAVTCVLAACALTVSFAGGAAPLNYPSKPLRVIVPYPAGAFNDQFARLLAKHLHQAWGQPAVVENRPGGSTLIGTDLAAKAPADGHTILITSFAFSVNPSLFAKLPYDTERDFVPVILAAQCPNVLVARTTLPSRTFMDLAAAARDKPGSINYASAGNGSSTHLAMELLKSKANVDMTHVPYKGSAPALTDLIAGQVDISFDNLPNVLPHIRAGKIRPLAVSSAKRAAALPATPTVAENGIAGFDVVVWFGIVVRAGTPADIIEHLNAETNRMLANPAIRRQFAAQGVEAVGGSAADFALYLKEQMQAWRSVIRSAGIKPE